MKIEHLYSPELFESLGAKATEVWAGFLQRAQSSDQVAFGDQSLHSLKELALAAMGQDQFQSDGKIDQKFEALFKFFFSHMTQLHNPRYIGHQTCAALPPAALFQAIGLITNQSSALSELSPSSTAIERAVVESLCKKIGYDENGDGFSTNGGTLANVTAVLAALNSRYTDFWSKGFSAFKGKLPIVIASAESHYCIERACGMLGLGADNLVKIPVDQKRKISIPHLKKFLSEYDRNLYEPFCIVATSGATPTGSFDPLIEVAEVAKANDLWLHVDGAHGASMLMSEKYRDLCRGIHLADSVTWDAHKMLFTPSLATFLLFKNRENSFKTFKPNAPYLFMPSDQKEDDASARFLFDGAHRTLECTRQSMALGVWGVWSLFGENVFAELIDRCNDLTKYFYEILKSSKDFAPVHEPECNILCFEYTNHAQKTEEERSLFQQEIRRQLLADGRFYITGTVVDRIYRLRVTVINPLTTKEHFQELLGAIRTISA